MSVQPRRLEVIKLVISLWRQEASLFFIFLVCTDFAFCQRPPGKLLLLNLFIVFFSVLIVFLKNFILVPTSYSIQRGKKFAFIHIYTFCIIFS